VLWLAGAYLVGAIPVGYVVSRILGMDIRQRGSGNIGATNVLRTAGWTPALVTLAGDVAKGYAATWLGSQAGPSPAWAGAGAVLAVVGNCWPVFLGFRGGKGVATGLGAFLRITPWAVLPAAAVWLTLVASFRFVSLASLCAVVGLPLAILALGYPAALVIAGLGIAVIIVARHHENVRRLLAGTENRFGQPRPGAGGVATGSGSPR
jgi:glycerol-3-phosphate acyltransferase PlsY